MRDYRQVHEIYQESHKAKERWRQMRTRPQECTHSDLSVTHPLDSPINAVVFGHTRALPFFLPSPVLLGFLQGFFTLRRILPHVLGHRPFFKPNRLASSIVIDEPFAGMKTGQSIDEVNTVAISLEEASILSLMRKHEHSPWPQR